LRGDEHRHHRQRGRDTQIGAWTRCQALLDTT
jgi:hypothetical protein